MIINYAETLFGGLIGLSGYEGRAKLR